MFQLISIWLLMPFLAAKNVYEIPFKKATFIPSFFVDAGLDFKPPPGESMCFAIQ